MKRGRPPIERVSERCVFEDRGYATPCRIFTGGKDPNGYGQICIGKTTVRTHIVTYEFTVGPVPEGLELDHLCQQKDCCATSHLEPVTHAVNVRRGRVGEANRARNAAITHCPRGHEYTPENTELKRQRDGYICRACKQCNRDRMRDNYHRRKREMAAAVVVALALMLPGSAGAARHAKAPAAGTPPEKPCRFENRLDIEIIAGVWFECSCEALMVGTVCDWYEITSPAEDPLEARKHRKITLKRPAPRRIQIHVAHPSVVA